MAYLDFYGGYQRIGPYTNVVLGGSPNNVLSTFGTPLTAAHDKGYGYGIEFTEVSRDTGNITVNVKLNLVGFSVNDSSQYVPNGGSYVGSENYRWILKTAYSTDGGSSYNEISSNVIFDHNPAFTMIYIYAGMPRPSGGTYQYGWETLAQNSQYSGNFTITNNTTHVKFTFGGAEEIYVGEQIFTIAQIIPDFRPMAVRKSNSFKSLNADTGFLKKRVSGVWQDIPKINFSNAGQPNQGSCRIRKSGVWNAQSQIGE